MQARGGFSLIEVIIAATVLVTALFGIMAAAFNMYRASDSVDEYMTASLLAAERLDYFRSQRDPYKAVGGTWYAPPADRRRGVDFNQDAAVHLITNERPTLFVREYVVGASEKRFRDPTTGRDLGKTGQTQRNATAASIAEASARRINWIPDTPQTIPGGTARVDGIVPNTDLNGTLTPVVPLAARPSIKGGAADTPFNFYRAPRCNEVLEFNPAAPDPVNSGQKTRGAAISNLSPAVRYVREVWVQTNHPLGRPFSTASADDEPGTGTLADHLPQFYATNPALVGDIARAAVNGNAGNKVSSTALPPWVVAVTVRVFKRDARVKSIKPNSTSLNNDPDGAFRGGLGYDPARPLATMVGYFGLRRFLQ